MHKDYCCGRKQDLQTRFHNQTQYRLKNGLGKPTNLHEKKWNIRPSSGSTAIKPGISWVWQQTKGNQKINHRGNLHQP